MKLNVIRNKAHEMPNYINHNVVEKGVSVSSVAEDGECSEILLGMVLETVDNASVPKVLEHFSRKLQHGGILKVHDVDMYSVAHAFAYQRIELEDFRKLVGGTQKEKYDLRLSHTTLASTVDILLKLGLKIISKKLDGFDYYITAERP